LLKHSDLLSRKAFVDPATGLLWAIRADGAMEQVTYPDGVTPAYRNLINASLMLFATNVVVAHGLEAVVDWAEGTGNESVVNSVTIFEANLNLARRCAIEGLENVAAAKKGT
jgi:hypothetical protein